MTSAAQARHVLDPAGTDVYGEFAALLADGPVVQVDLGGGLLAWDVLGYDEAVKVLKMDRPRNRLVSKNAAKYWRDMKGGRVSPDLPMLMWVQNAGMFTADDPEHVRLRNWAQPAFSPRRIEQLGPMIDQIVAGKLDTIEKGRPSGLDSQVVDLRAEFCFPVPMDAIGALLGVPDDLAPVIQEGADALFDTALAPEEAGKRIVALLGAIDEMVSRKTAEPGQDLVSDLIKAMQESGTYTLAELLETVRVIIVAGYETTRYFIAQVILTLLSHPQHLAAVLAGDLSWDDILDEALRCVGTAATLPLRFAVKDFQLGGAKIREGDAILLSYAAAGRDPRKHQDPAVFDPTRPNKDHLGFGRGAHYCLGAPFAVDVTKRALIELFARYPDITLVEDPANIPANQSWITNGPARLLVNLGAPAA